MRQILRCSTVTASLILLWTSEVIAQVPWAPATGAFVETRVDTFDTANNFKAAAFPAGTIWSGTWNKDSGGATAVFSSSGGALTMEDLRLKNNSAGLNFGTAWEGPNNGGSSNAPFLYTTIDSPTGKAYDLDIFAKVSSQWNGNWSKSAIVARVAGVAPGKDPGTGAFPATETFISAGTFLPQDNFQVQRVLNGVDAGVQTGNAADRTNVASDAFWTDPIWVAVIKRQSSSVIGTFRFFTSTDDVATPDLVTTWVDAGIQSSGSSFFGNGVNVDVGLSHHNFFSETSGGDIPAGQRPHTMWDYFSVTTYNTDYVAPGPTYTWNINNDNLALWSTAGNWLFGPCGLDCSPNGNTHHAVFGSVITQPRTVILNANRMVKWLTFDNVNTYALSGLFRLTMAAASGQATIEALQGSHLIQVPMTFNSTTNLVAANANARLDFNNELNLNGQTVNVSGPGRVFINSILDAGANGVVNSTGNLGGSGRINGSLTATGGSINPGNGLGTLTVDNGYTQTSTTLIIELGGTTAGLFDKLVVTGIATLTSGVVDVTTVNGFVPSDGSFWDIVTATGTLTSGLTVADAGYALSVVGSGLRLSFNTPVGCTPGPCGDYNVDGSVNAADYTVWRNYPSGICVGIGSCLPNDPTPASVDFNDYQYWRLHYGEPHAGSGSSLGDSSSVPEPSALVLLLLGVCGFRSLIRRR